MERYRDFADAFNRRDIDSLIALADPEFDFESRFSSVAGQTYHGYDGLRAWMADLADVWERIEVEIEEAAEVSPGRAVALIVLHGLGRGSGVEIHEPRGHLTDWRDGRLVRLRYVEREDADLMLTGARITVATFDCYGTLVDWEGGLGTFLYSLALRNGDREPDPGEALRRRWEEIQFRLITEGPYRRYKEVLVDALREWVGERGYRWNAQDGDELVTSMRSWQPFPDVRPALTQARDAGLRLVIVSNTDRDIVEHTVRQIGVEFDDIQVAEDVRAYKPDRQVFESALARVGAQPSEVLHVAFGFKYDIGPAAALGLRTAWVNRHVEELPGETVPDHEWRDLWGLARLAGGEGPRQTAD